MTKEPHQHLEELFAAALDRPSDQRNEFLNEMCEDQALRRKLQGLLDSHEQADAFFDGFAREVATSSALELETATRSGIRFGPYQTEQVIGQGGMGVVFLARRVDGEFEQQVALKLIHLDMETPHHRARFLAERQLLALLSHPNIARLLDGGVTDEGRPHFVMEYVQGVPITRYCRERRLPLTERLDLFRSVIDAVSYLHRNLVVHRDLKPSNILVEGGGQVKLLDFGVAKLLSNELGPTETTRTGLKHLTPQYAAPEQFVGGLVTTATDVYSLGLVLYELLTGQLPPERTEDEFSRTGPPEVTTAPSKLVRSQRQGIENGQGKSAGEPAEAILKWRSIAGDLDNICLQALQSEPDRRYPSAEQFGQDIDRHLSGVPVLARNNTFTYRLSKFVQRHRWTAAATGVLVVLVVAGFLRERGLRDEAELAQIAAIREASKAMATSEFLQELFAAVDPDKAQGREVTVADVLAQASERLASRESFLQEPLVEAEVRLTIGNTYRSLGKFLEAKPHLEQAYKLRKQSLGESDPETLRALESLGVWHYRQFRFAEAEPLIREVLDSRTQILGEDHPDTLTAMGHLANLLWGLERFDEVETLDRKTLDIRQRVLGNAHPDTLKSMNGLAATLHSQARYAEAIEVFEQALPVRRELSGASHPDTLMLTNNLAASYTEMCRYAEAEPLLQEVLKRRLEVLGEDREDTAMSMHNLALALAGQAQHGEAETLLRRAIAVRRSKKYTDHTRLLQSMGELAGIYAALDRFDEAESLYLSTLAQLSSEKGPEDADTLKTTAGLADLRRLQGDLGAAEKLVGGVLEAQVRLLGKDHPSVLQTRITAARVKNAQGRFAEAADTSASVVSDGSSTLGSEHPLVLEATVEQVEALLGEKRLEEAERLAPTIYTVRAARLGEQHPETVRALELVLTIYRAMGNGTEVKRYRGLLEAGKEP